MQVCLKLLTCELKIFNHQSSTYFLLTDRRIRLGFDSRPVYKMRMATKSKEQSIRSISRALHVLQAINRHGALTMTQISQIVKLPYPTACRVVYTLVGEGVIERETSRKYYRATALAQSLSCGYQAQARLVAIARPHIVNLTNETGWPVSIASRVGSVMVIQDSTHGQTALTFSDYHPGYSLPIASSASGMVYLAYTNAEERAQIIEQIKRTSLDEDAARLTDNLRDNQFQLILDDGFASFIRNPHTKDPGKTSSIAVPLFRDEALVGAMTFVFFSTSLRVKDAFDKYGKAIFAAQDAINRDLVEMKLFKPEDLQI